MNTRQKGSKRPTEYTPEEDYNYLKFLILFLNKVENHFAEGKDLEDFYKHCLPYLPERFIKDIKSHTQKVVKTPYAKKEKGYANFSILGIDWIRDEIMKLISKSKKISQSELESDFEKLVAASENQGLGKRLLEAEKLPQEQRPGGNNFLQEKSSHLVSQFETAATFPNSSINRPLEKASKRPRKQATKEPFPVEAQAKHAELGFDGLMVLKQQNLVQEAMYLEEGTVLEDGWDSIALFQPQSSLKPIGRAHLQFKPPLPDKIFQDFCGSPLQEEEIRYGAEEAARECSDVPHDPQH